MLYASFLFEPITLQISAVLGHSAIKLICCIAEEQASKVTVALEDLPANTLR